MSIVFLLWLEYVLLCYFAVYFISIMTGEDSSNADSKSVDYGRSTPPPTTSYSSKKQEFGDAKSAAEPDKDDKEKNKDDKEEIDLLRPDANPGYKPEEKTLEYDDNKINKDDRDYSGRDRDEKDKQCKKLDGSDKLDGVWLPPKDAKPDCTEDDDDDDDNCTVKCLYYTMQCCECTIS